MRSGEGGEVCRLPDGSAVTAAICRAALDDGVSPYMGRHGEIWGDMGRYGEIWGDMGRYGEMCGDRFLARRPRTV